MKNNKYERIITHNDFDGIISACICSYCLGVNFFVFTGPRVVAEARLPITHRDVVCDLPYPLECGLWFDHHEGNLEEVRYRKIDPATIPGRFEALPSCAHVVYNHFHDRHLPDHFPELVAQADILDAFDYKDIEDWRQETPAKIIDGAIKLDDKDRELKWQFMRSLILQLKERPLTAVADSPSVRKRYRAYLLEEEKMLQQVAGEISFLPQDSEHKIIIIDLTRHNRQPHILKQLAFLLHPQALAVIEINSIFRNQVKSNDFSISMSLSLNFNSIEHTKDVGDIMRTLNIGSGHPGAGAGVVRCNSKDEMLKTKARILGQIFTQFMAQ